MSGIAIADADDAGADLTTRLQVTTGVLAVTLSGAATISAGSIGSGDLTILGTESEINATLATLTYTGNTDVVGIAADTLTVTTDDQGNTGSGGALQDVDTVQIDITAVNDAPVNTVPGTQTIAEETTASISGISIADVDDGGANLTTRLQVTNGALAVTLSGAATISAGSIGSGDLTILGTESEINATLATLTYTGNTDVVGIAADTLTVTTNDQGNTGSGGALQDADTVQIDITAVNDPPINTVPGTQTVAEETTTAISGISIADADDAGANLTTRLQVTNGVLVVTLSGAAAISAGSIGSGDLTILGTESDINATLATLTFTGDADIVGVAADTLTVTTNDQGNTGSGGAQQDADSVQIDITAVNDAPVNTVPGTQTVAEETTRAISGISIADADDAGANLTTRLQVTNGVLAVTLSGAATISAGSIGSSDLTILGTESEINATLATLTYTGDADVVGVAADTLTVTTNDQGNTGSGGAQQDADSVQIDITAVNDSPVNTVPGTQTVAEETTKAISGISIADVDDAGANLTTRLQVTNGILAVTLSGAATVSAGSIGSGDLTILGTESDINATLATLTYTGDAEVVGVAADTLTVTTNDQGNTGSGGAQQDTDTIQIDITAVNDAPVNTVPGTQTIAEETTTAISGISIADTDDGGADLTTRLQVSDGVLAVSLSGLASIVTGANGSADLTLQGNETDINATLATLTYTGDTDIVGVAADTLVVTTNDQGNTGSGGSQQDVDTIQIDITAVNDAPVNTVPGTQTVSEEATTSISGISITDADDAGANLTTRLQVTNGVLAVTLSGAATISAGSIGSDDLTILGTESDINATLATLTYTGDAEVVGVAADTLTVTTNDQGNTGSGGALQDADSVQIDITAVNDPPVNTVPGTQTVAEEATTSISGIAIADTDDAGANLTTRLQVSNGVLAVTLSGAASISAGSIGSSDLTILGTESDINATLATLTYTGDTDVVGVAADTLTVTTNDQGNTGTGGAQQDADSVQIDITAVNDAPVNTVPGTLTIAEEATTSIAGVSIADTDDAGASLTTRLQVSSGVLAVTLSGAATISAGSIGSGDLTILGTESDINATLATLTYTGDADVVGVAADSLTVTTNDQGNTGTGGAQQDADSVQIDITAVNDAPVNTVPGTQTVAEEATTAISGISIADVDDAGAILSTRLQVGNGVLSVTLSGAAVVSAGSLGSADLTVQGTKAEINATLATLTYTGGADVVGIAADSLLVTTNDLGNTGSGGALQDADSVQIDITAVNDAPVNTVPGTQTIAEETTTSISGISIADVDDLGADLATRLQVGNGVLLVSLSGSAVISAGGNGSADLTIQGSEAEVNATLATLSYTGDADVVGIAADTLTVTTSDLGNTGSGGAQQDADNVQIDIAAVNDAPVNTVPGTQTVAEETSSVISGISIADADDAGADLTTRLQVTSGVISVVLSGSTSISAGSNDSADLTIQGSKAEINATLATLAYIGNAEVNGVAADTLTITTNDLGNTGSGGAQQDIDTVQINITAVNDAPVNSVPGTLTVAEETTTVVSGISVADADDAGAALTTRLQVSNGVVLVSLSGSATISAGSNGSADLTIQGSKAEINATLATLTYRGDVDVVGTGADTLIVTSNDLGNTGSGGPQLDTDNVQINITAVNDAPVNTVPGTQTASEETVTTISGISIADVDDAGAGLTTRLQVSNGTLAVTLSGAASVVAGSNGSADLTLLGTEAELNATLASLSYTGNLDVTGTAADSLVVTTNDQGNTGAGGAQQDSDSIQINIAAVNDAPVNTVPGTQTVAEEATTAMSGIAIADADDAGADLTTRLQVTNGVLAVTLSGAATISAGSIGSGDLTILGTESEINATLATLTYTGNTDVVGIAADTLTVTTDDQGNTGSGGALQDVNTVQIDITAVNDAPVNTVPGTQTIAEETTASISGISIADADDGGADVTTRLQVSNGVLFVSLSGSAFISAGSIGTADLTIRGSKAEVNATLATLTYTGDTDVVGIAADTLTVTTDDQGNTGSGGAQQDADSVQIDITAVNDSPVNTVPGTQTIAEETTTAISGISIADADDAGANLTTRLQVTNGALAVTLSGAATISAGSIASGDLTILGTESEINATLATLTYTGDTDIVGVAADTLTVTTNDQGNTGSGGALQDADSVQIDITAVNDAPVNTVPGTQTIAEETTASISGISVADVDGGGGNLTTRLQVSNGVLAVSLSGLASIVTGANGSADLTLQGNETDINATLATLTYTGNTDVVGIAADTLTVTTNDQGNTGSGGALQDADSVQIDITAVNDAPVNTVPGTQTIAEETTASISGISIADVDDGGGNLTTRLQVSNGALAVSLSGLASIVTGANGSADLTLQGNETDINATLATLTYTGDADIVGVSADTLVITTNDQGNTGTGGAQQDADSVQIDITAVNDAPVNTVPGTQIVAEEATASISGISIADVDDAGANLTTRLQVNNGVLTVGLSGATSVVAGANGSADMTVQGSEADINATLSTLTYTGDVDVVGTAADTLTVTTDDQGNSGSGGALQDVDTVQIDLTAVNDAPVNTVPGTQTVAEEATTAIGGISIADADAAGASLTTRLQVSNGRLGITLSGAASIIGGSNNTADLTVQGSRAELNAVLASLTYTGDMDFVGVAADTLIVTTNDQGNTGAGGAQQDVDAVQINVTAVNDAPVISLPGSQTVAEETTATISGISIADIDDAGADLTTRLQVSNGNLVVTLSGSASLVAGSNGSADMTIRGTEADINATLAGLTYTGNANVVGVAADTLLITANDLGNTGSGGALQAVGSLPIDITAVNDPPVITMPGTQNFVEEVAAGINGISIADADHLGAVLSARTQVSNGILNLTLAGSVVIIGGANDSADITVQGTLTDLNTTLSSLIYTGNSEVNGVAADTLTVTSNDLGNTGSGGALQDTESLQINLAAVDDPPSLQVNTGALLDEGGIVAMTSAMLQIADVDTTPGARVITIASAPVTGQLLLNGVPIGAGQGFTQDDLDNNRVSYQHDGAEVFADSFAFTFRDATSGELGGPEVFSFSVNPLNDNDPLINAPFAHVIAENTTAVTNLTASDSDLPAQALTFSLTGGPDAALFSVTSTGAISFRAPADFESPADTDGDNSYELIVQVDDNAGRVSTQALTVSVVNVNEAPAGLDQTVTFNEDSSHVVSLADFGFSDPDAGDNFSAVRIDAAPGLGTLTLSGSPVSAGQVIAAADILAGNLVYTPQADANGNGYASLQFSVQDGGGLFADAPDRLTFTVLPVNDAPAIDAPVRSAATEETPSSIVGVSVSDPDGSGIQLQTRLQVSNGVLDITLAGSAVIVSGANGSADLSIQGTQSDLNASFAGLAYTPGLNVSGAGVDTLFITTGDLGNAGAGGALLDTRSVLIDVSNVNDPPSLAVNTGGVVAEGGTMVVTTAMLSIADSDTPSQFRLLTLSAVPQSGSLVLNGVALDTGNTFSQADLEAGRLEYRHNGAEVFEDQFRFTYADPATGPIGPELFSITVTPVNEAPHSLSPGEAFVSEAIDSGSAIVVLSALDPDDGDVLRFLLVSNPENRFHLNADTGQLSLATGAALDYEQRVQHELRIQVTDASGLTDERVFIVYVLDEVESDGLGSDNQQAAPPVVETPLVAVNPVFNRPEASVESGSRATISLPADTAVALVAAVEPVEPTAAVFSFDITQLTGPDGYVGPVENLPGFKVSVSFDWVPPGTIGVELSSLDTLSARRVTVDFTELEYLLTDRNSEESFVEILLDPIRLAGTVMSIGAVWWLTRSGGLIATILMGIPTWRHLDLLPIVSRQIDDDDQLKPSRFESDLDDVFGDTLGALLQESQRRDQPSHRGRHP
ncbi:MAG: cadherin-like domain-containing protein [Burkholderiaceae bacterium]